MLPSNIRAHHSTRPVPDGYRLRQVLAGGQVDLELLDGRENAPVVGSLHVRLPVVVPKDRGVVTLEIEENGIRPAIAVVRPDVLVGENDLTGKH